MRHRLQWFIQLRAHGLDREMSTPPTGHDTLYLCCIQRDSDVILFYMQDVSAAILQVKH